MANGHWLDEWRELSKNEKNISAQAHRRLSLAAIADVYGNQEEHYKKYEKLEERVEKVEKKVSIIGKAEIALAALSGWIATNIK